MRTVQVLDALRSRASHREIAEGLFGAGALDARWSSDSELRAQVRHLIRRGRKLSTDGYRKLIGLPASGREISGRRSNLPPQNSTHRPSCAKPPGLPPAPFSMDGVLAHEQYPD
jgi:hypothetical protein